MISQTDVSKDSPLTQSVYFMFLFLDNQCPILFLFLSALCCHQAGTEMFLDGQATPEFQDTGLPFSNGIIHKRPTTWVQLLPRLTPKTTDTRKIRDK